MAKKTMRQIRRNQIATVRDHIEEDTYTILLMYNISMVKVLANSSEDTLMDGLSFEFAKHNVIYYQQEEFHRSSAG